MTEVLKNYLRNQDGVRCMALIQGSPVVLSSLGTLAEVCYAAGQMACLLAAHYQRKLGAEYRGWETNGGAIPAAISEEELFRAVSEVDSPVVLGAAHAAWLEWWPAGSSSISGFASAKVAMAELGHVLFNPTGHPTSSLAGSKPHSLGVRVKAALMEFEATGRTLHNETLFRQLLGMLGGTFLVAAHEVNLA